MQTPAAATDVGAGGDEGITAGPHAAAEAGKEEGCAADLAWRPERERRRAARRPYAATEAGGKKGGTADPARQPKQEGATGERARRARRSEVGRIRMRWDPYNSRNAYIVVKVLNNWNTSILGRRE